MGGDKWDRDAHVLPGKKHSSFCPHLVAGGYSRARSGQVQFSGPAVALACSPVGLLKKINFVRKISVKVIQVEEFDQKLMPGLRLDCARWRGPLRKTTGVGLLLRAAHTRLLRVS